MALRWLSPRSRNIWRDLRSCRRNPGRLFCEIGADVKLQVVDEGSGITPEEIDRIFEKFHRAEKQDQVRAGTGLGLAISRGFIEAMDGSITCANRSDRQGAVFTIILPIPKPTKQLDTAA